MEESEELISQECQLHLLKTQNSWMSFLFMLQTKESA